LQCESFSLYLRGPCFSGEERRKIPGMGIKTERQKATLVIKDVVRSVFLSLSLGYELNTLNVGIKEKIFACAGSQSVRQAGCAAEITTGDRKSLAFAAEAEE
jgi:hypothetical protein